jgi:hypothetical protein
MLKKYRTIIIILAVLVIICAIWCVWYMKYLNKTHSTFENYYAFRGCTELLERTDTYGICKTDSGQTIKIVKFDNRWFLDGDLPCGFLCF